ncbi:MAG: DUF4445 domain-containing protein [Clostridiales bacterium]|nr:DUF4445 domain-containing protein [Candidatus Apopatocola equi]
MPKITFRFSDGKEIVSTARSGESLMEIAKGAGVDIDAPCGGNGTCGKCRVRLLEGEVDCKQSKHISDEDWAKGWRLACQSKILDACTVEVPDSASAFKTGIRTADLNDPATFAIFENIQSELGEVGLMQEKAVFSAIVSMNVPTLDDTMPDNERLIWAAEEATGCENITLSYNALMVLASVLRENDFTVRCVFARKGDALEILDVLDKDDTGPICGVAVDIGTTTVTCCLVDLESGKLHGKASAGNGQIRYGADVINRIIQSVKPGGAEKLRKAVVDETLLPLLDSVCHQGGISRKHIYRICIAGNTTMEHLLLGVFADPVRMEPFVPSFFSAGNLRAADVLPGLNTAATLVLAPNVGSYVGGDITAGVLSCELWRKSELSLFIDLGTNGEIVLGNSDFMLTCACSAGPAFEGGEISHGMRATDGAIEEITIDKESMEPTFSVIGESGTKPVGLCGSGLIDIVAALFRTGIIDPKGKFHREGRRIRRDEHGQGRYVIAFEDESGDGSEVSINETDIDNFIRAKGAIFSAVLLMLRKLDMTPDMLDYIWIAGGIGSGIDFKNAITIGMFPDVELEKFHYIGNSSLTGSYAMLLAVDAEAKVEELGRNMSYVELSNEPSYMDEFVSACFLPHTTASLFPSVEVE